VHEVDDVVLDRGVVVLLDEALAGRLEPAPDRRAARRTYPLPRSVPTKSRWRPRKPARAILPGRLRISG